MRKPSEKVSRNTSLAVGHLTHRARKQEGLAPASLEEKPSVDPGLAREGGTWKPPRTSTYEDGSPWRWATGLNSTPTPPTPTPQTLEPSLSWAPLLIDLRVGVSHGPQEGGPVSWSSAFVRLGHACTVSWFKHTHTHTVLITHVHIRTHTHTHCPHGAHTHTHTSLHYFLVQTHAPTHTHIHCPYRMCTHTHTHTHAHTVLIAPSHCLRRLEWDWKEAILVCRSLNKPLQPATSHPPNMQPLLGGDQRENCKC